MLTMADDDCYYYGLWPLGEGMRRRGDRDLVAVVCGFLSCALLVAWLWQLGIGMGFVRLI